MKDISKDPELQTAFVHGMMFAHELAKAGMNVESIGIRLSKIWALGDVERCAQEYADKIGFILLQRDQ